MLNKYLTTLLLILSLVAVNLPVVAETDTSATLPDNVPALLVKANDAYLAKDYLTFRQTLERLHTLRPYNGQYMYQLVIAHALLDEKTPAYDMMLKMQQSGLSYDLTKTENTRNIRDTEVFEFVNDMMVMAGNPLGESETAFTLPPEVALPVAITWDESRQKFLVGTVADGSILAVGKDGEVTELLKADADNGMWSVLDILVDQPRNRLWVSSAAIAAFKGYKADNKGRSALFEYNLETLDLVRRYPVPVDGKPHILGSMVQSPNGDILIVDRALPIVYRKAANEQQLKALLASGDMVSMRGVAMQPDGNIMYIADRELGILVVDLKGSKAMKLITPETLNLGGIDGLYLWNNHLVIIQNGISPQRIMRLQLDSTGTRVAAIRPLAVAQPAFDMPSFGTKLGEDLYYFASSQATTNNDPPKAVTVLRTPLNSSEDLVGPDMEAYMNERARKQEARNKAAREKAAAEEAARQQDSENKD